MASGALRSDFTREVFLQQPLAVSMAIADDVRSSFSYPRTNRQADTPISRWQFQTSYPVFPPELPLAREAWIMRRFGGGTPGVVRPVAAALRAYQLDGGYTPGPLLALGCLIGIAGAAGADRLWDQAAGGSWDRLRRGLRSRRRERLWGRRRRHSEHASAPPPPAVLRAACFLVTATAILPLLGADIVEFSWRYQLPGLVTLPLAGALGFTALTNRPRRTASAPQAVALDRPRAEAADQLTVSAASQPSTRAVRAD